MKTLFLALYVCLSGLSIITNDLPDLTQLWLDSKPKFESHYSPESDLKIDSVNSFLNINESCIMLYNDAMPIDSVTIRNILDIGYNIGVTANNNQPFIKGIPNPLLHTLTMLLFGWAWRWGEKRRLRKKGLLIDKKIIDSSI